MRQGIVQAEKIVDKLRAKFYYVDRIPKTQYSDGVGVMSEKLKAYEVIGGLLGACMEQTQENKLPLLNRTALYACVRTLCMDKPDKIFPFEFRQRAGRWTSPEVDLTIRNLEDSKRLECLNPDLVDFRWTSVGAREYKEKIKPRLERLGVSMSIEEGARQLLAPYSHA